MPYHLRVALCRRGGLISAHCTCEHCTSLVCAVCGASGRALTSECPGEVIGAERQEEVRETSLDYTDARGWHQGSPRRVPSFVRDALMRERSREKVLAVSRVEGPSVGLDAGSSDGAPFAPASDLRDALAHRAIAWALADREADDLAIDLVRLEKEVAERLGAERAGSEGDALGRLEQVRRAFRAADQRAVRCDEEFRQVARGLERALPRASAGMFAALTREQLRELFARHCECRPLNTARISHSHDCDTGRTDDVRTVLHAFVVGPDEQGPVAASEDDRLGALRRLVDGAEAASMEREQGS